jgi:hypothetical protein
LAAFSLYKIYLKHKLTVCYTRAVLFYRLLLRSKKGGEFCGFAAREKEKSPIQAGGLAQVGVKRIISTSMVGCPHLRQTAGAIMPFFQVIFAVLPSVYGLNFVNFRLILSSKTLILPFLKKVINNEPFSAQSRSLWAFPRFFRLFAHPLCPSAFQRSEGGVPDYFVVVFFLLVFVSLSARFLVGFRAIFCWEVSVVLSAVGGHFLPVFALRGVVFAMIVGVKGHSGLAQVGTTDH